MPTMTTTTTTPMMSDDDDDDESTSEGKSNAAATLTTTTSTRENDNDDDRADERHDDFNDNDTDDSAGCGEDELSPEISSNRVFDASWSLPWATLALSAVDQIFHSTWAAFWPKPPKVDPGSRRAHHVGLHENILERPSGRMGNFQGVEAELSNEVRDVC